MLPETLWTHKPYMDRALSLSSQGSKPSNISSQRGFNKIREASSGEMTTEEGLVGSCPLGQISYGVYLTVTTDVREAWTNKSHYGASPLHPPTSMLGAVCDFDCPT